jgi:hypothetical protein
MRLKCWIEDIKRLRREIIHQAVTLLKDCIKSLIDGNPQTYQCRNRNRNKHPGPNICDIVALGSMLRSLPTHIRDFALDRFPTSTYFGSVTGLIKVLEAIKLVSISEDHQHCNPIPGIVLKIRAKAQEAERLVTKEHIDHLMMQKQKTGVHVLHLECDGLPN